MTPEDRALLREVCENGSGEFCRKRHEVHEQDGSVWVTCQTDEENHIQIGRTRIDPDRDDLHERARKWAHGVVGAHMRAVSCAAMLELLDEVESAPRSKLYIPGFQA